MQGHTTLAVALMVMAGLAFIAASIVATGPWHLSRWLGLGGGFLWLVLAVVTYRKAKRAS